MRPGKIIFLCLTLAALCVPVLAQEGTPDEHARVAILILEATGTPSATAERLDAVLAPVVCDVDQNLYFRKLGPDPGSSPLMRISANGRASVIFDPSKLPGNSREADLLAFTVDGQGRVHEIVRLVEGKQKLSNYLVVFSKDGDIAGRTKLEADLIPAAFTALESGDYFLSGTTVKKSREDVPQPLTAIIDSSGRVKLNLQALDDAVNAGGNQDTLGDSSRAGNPKLSAIENGTSIYGPDKNIYLFRASDPVHMKVISPTGKVLRDIELKPPFKGGAPFEFRLSGNRVLVGFRSAKTGKESGEVTPAPAYVIFDSDSGEPILHYHFGESIRGALGCFSGDRFTFLTGTRDGRFAILEAKAK